MIIDKITFSIDNNYLFKSLNTASKKPTNQYSVIVPNVPKTMETFIKS